ncbi:MAG: hypothetical protein EXR73_11535 [Myxococcales bacterium]|nr:hypothetical protein [Myxococcales bacterium]
MQATKLEFARALERFTLGGDAPKRPVEAELLPTGWPELDELLSGGLPRGRLIELRGVASSGKTALAFATAARASAAGQLVAWIDATGELHPPSAAQAGVELARLLVVRPPRTPLAAARAAEILARARIFALVVLDLPAALPDRAAARLRIAARDAGAALLVIGGEAPHAALRLAIAPQAPQAERGEHETDRRGLSVTVLKGSATGARAEVTLGRPALTRTFHSPEALQALGVASPTAAARAEPGA